LQAIEDRQILRILQRQKEIGFEIFTDGKFRRSNFMSDFTDAVEGFDFDDAYRSGSGRSHLAQASSSETVRVRSDHSGDSDL